MGTLLVAAGVGLLVGFVCGRNHKDVLAAIAVAAPVAVAILGYLVEPLAEAILCQGLTDGPVVTPSPILPQEPGPLLPPLPGSSDPNPLGPDPGPTLVECLEERLEWLKHAMYFSAGSLLGFLAGHYSAGDAKDPQ